VSGFLFAMPSKGGGTTAVRLDITPDSFGDILKTMLATDKGNLKETQRDRKFFRITGEDTREDTRTDKVDSAASITAKCGEFDGSIAVLDHDKPLTIRRASSVTISRVPQREEVLEHFRSKGGKLWMGHTSINTSTEAVSLRGRQSALGALAFHRHLDREKHASDPLPPYSRVKIDSPGADGIDR
jgi:hypothetical protein